MSLLLLLGGGATVVQAPPPRGCYHGATLAAQPYVVSVTRRDNYQVGAQWAAFYSLASRGGTIYGTAAIWAARYEARAEPC